ncbi:MAG: hypothetical protein FJ279_20025 [Planctomycetes bacterium]|nr:hypothetical protein [Planctomycetota bacterium]
MIDSISRDRFWMVVEDCLVTFHALSRDEARKRTQELRVRIERDPTGMPSEMVYHAEPFDVACDIAEKPQELPENRQEYDAILSRHSW